MGAVMAAVVHVSGGPQLEVSGRGGTAGPVVGEAARRPDPDAVLSSSSPNLLISSSASLAESKSLNMACADVSALLAFSSVPGFPRAPGITGSSCSLDCLNTLETGK